MSDKPKFKLPESLIKATAKAADVLKVEYRPVEVNVNININISPEQQDNVASHVAEAMKVYHSMLQKLPVDVRSAVLQGSTATAALASGGGPEDYTTE